MKRVNLFKIGPFLM